MLSLFYSCIMSRGCDVADKLSTLVCVQCKWYFHVCLFKVSVYSVPEKKEYTDYALETASKLLEFYNNVPLLSFGLSIFLELKIKMCLLCCCVSHRKEGWAKPHTSYLWLICPTTGCTEIATNCGFWNI